MKKACQQTFSKKEERIDRSSVPDIGLKPNPLTLIDAVHSVLIVPKGSGASSGAVVDVNSVHFVAFLLAPLDDYIIHRAPHSVKTLIDHHTIYTIAGCKTF